MLTDELTHFIKHFIKQAGKSLMMAKNWLDQKIRELSVPQK